MDFINGQPCWAGLSTTEADASATFYREVFGWSIESQGSEHGDYRIAAARTDSGPVAVAGLSEAMDEASPTDAPAHHDAEARRANWTLYLHFDEIEQSVDEALHLGATTIMEPTEVGEQGSMALLNDPVGAVIGLWQPGTHRGFEAVAEPGCPAWFDLHTKDFDAARSFYGRWLGVEFEQPEGFPDTYASAKGPKGDYLFGMMDVSQVYPPEQPSTWNTYYLVDSAGDTLRRAVDLGAFAMMDADPSPYGFISAFADPRGATIFAIGGR